MAHLSEQIFDAIVEKKQTCIAKINGGLWHDVKNGQTITFTDGKREIDVVIDTPSFFNNFGDAWFTHGENLLPSFIADVVTIAEADRYCRSQYTSEDITDCGVVVFTFHLCSQVRNL